MIGLDQQLACVQRELAMRRVVYPRWIEQGRMTQAKADYEIACMEAVEQTLKAVLPPKPQQKELFQ